MENTSDTTVMDTVVAPAVDTSAAPPVDKKTANREQLKTAREAVKANKRARDQDLSDIKNQLASLTSQFRKKPEKVEEEEDEPVQKRTKVTRDPVESTKEESVGESFGAFATKTGIALSLGLGGWIFRNKLLPSLSKPAAAPKRHTPVRPAIPTVQPQTQNNVGRSGFST